MLGDLDGILGRLDGFGTGRQLADGEIGRCLADGCLGELKLGGGIVELSLGRDTPLGQVLGTGQRALGLVGLGPGRAQCRLEHGDLFRALADPEVGELRLGLGKGGFRLGDCDVGVGRFHHRHRLASFDAVAAADGDGIDLRHLDGGKQHIIALDIADGEWRRPGAGRKQRDGERDGTEDAHGFPAFRAAVMAATFSLAMVMTLAASAGPMSDQPMRLTTAARAMRK